MCNFSAFPMKAFRHLSIWHDGNAKAFCSNMIPFFPHRDDDTSMAKNPYQKLVLQHGLISDCMTRNGAAINEVTKDGKGDEIYSYLHNTVEHKFKLFHLGNGTFTIGQCAGYCKDTYNFFAEKIKSECGGDNLPFDYTKSGLAPKADEILAFLQANGANIEDDKNHTTHRQLRVRGPQKDTLTIKIFNNKSVQFQGKRLNLASLLCDYLINVLSLDDAINSQIEIFSIPLTIVQIKDDFEARAPIASQYIKDVVRAQLSSALALTRVQIPVEDHSYIAYPALRGLEGFMKDVLVAAEFAPAPNADFSDYFHNKALRPDQARHAGPVKTDVLNRCYPLWSDQRHRLFHMDAPSDTSRMLNAAEAVDIVNRVLDLINHSSQLLVKE